MNSLPTHQPTAPGLRHAFTVRATIEEATRIGHAGAGELWFTPVVGGTVEGPRLSGVVLPGGGDWSTTRGRHGTDLDARYLLRADDGSVVDIVNRGFWVAEEDVDEASARGERVDPSRYYFRTQPVVRTDAPQHEWLCRTVFVGVAYDDAPERQIRIEFFEVL